MESKKPPVEKIIRGDIQLLVWENESQKSGTFNSFQLVKTKYSEEKGGRTSYNSFVKSDLPDALAVLIAANSKYRIRVEATTPKRPPSDSDDEEDEDYDEPKPFKDYAPMDKYRQRGGRAE